MPRRSRRYSLLLAAILAAAPAAAIDLQPGEVRAPPPGIDFMMLTYQHSERGGRYVDGEKLPGDPRLTSSQYQLRLGHAFELAGRPALFFAQAPVGVEIRPEGDLAGLKGDSGLGDTLFLLAAWPYADRVAETYFGLGAYLIAPTGDYRAERPFNVGENRYRTALQAGYQTQITPRLQGMAAVDALWSGKNDEYRATHATLEQDVLYSAQASLRYDFNPRYALGAGLFHSVGGETHVDGVASHDATRLQRYQLTGTANFDFGRVTLQYGADLHTRNGLFEKHRWLLRYSRRF